MSRMNDPSKHRRFRQNMSKPGRTQLPMLRNVAITAGLFLFLGVLGGFNPNNPSAYFARDLGSNAAASGSYVDATPLAKLVSPAIALADDFATGSPTRAALAPTPAATVFEDIARGHSNQSVRQAQLKLIEYGYLSGTANGTFDSSTESAVEAFQQSNGLYMTGIIDGETFDALINGDVVQYVDGQSVSHPIAAASPEYAATAPIVSATASPDDAASEAYSSEEDRTAVWIPKSGKRYHKDKDCSSMHNPSSVTLSEAAARGYTPCQKCCG